MDLAEVLNSMGTAETTDLLIERLTNTKSNDEFIELVVNSSFAENIRS